MPVVGQLFNRIEQTSCAMGQGRMDQYLLRYYRDDLAAGRITDRTSGDSGHTIPRICRLSCADGDSVDLGRVTTGWW